MADARVTEDRGLRSDQQAIVQTSWVSEAERTAGHGHERRPRAEWIEGYDWIRLIAAVDIIILHVAAPQSALIGHGGVPAFLMIAGSLPATRPELGPFATFARRRAKRILVPWLCWCAFYGAIAGARYLRHGIVPAWTVSYIFVGTSVHLWFFPAIYIGTLIVWIVLRTTRAFSTAGAALGVTALGAILFCGYALTFSHANLPVPFGHWFYSIPALIIGVGLGLAWRVRRGPAGPFLIGAAGVLTILGAVVNLMFGRPQAAISYSLAGVFVPIALLLPLRSNRFLRSFSDASLGVYAAHPFMFLALRSIVAEGLIPVWFSVVLVATSALAFSKLLRRVPYAKAMV